MKLFSNTISILKKTPLFLATASASALAQADATISIVADQQNATMLVKDQKVRFISNNPQGAQNEAIFDVVTQTLTVIDHLNKTRFPMSNATVNQLGGTINGAVNTISKQLEGMPSEQRSRMEKMMGDLGISLPKKTNKPALRLVKAKMMEVLDISCRETRVYEGNTHLNTFCVTEENSTPLSTQDYQSLLSAQTFMINAARKLSPLAEKFGQQIPQVGDISIDGLIVNGKQHTPYKTGKTQTGQRAEIRSDFSLTEISTATIKPIGIPIGYKTKSLFN